MSSIIEARCRIMTKPTSVVIKEVYHSLVRSTITVEPFERGFGNTIGNALRRVLLSSIAGFAVTSIKIEGLMHEYSVIEGVVEDVQDIMMNIKSLSISRNDTSPCVLKLFANKPGPVYAGAIECPADTKIINKDLVICTINKGAKLNVSMNVEWGKGYVIPEAKDKHDVETFMVSSVFSPIKKVAYHVENTRVGQVTDYDKLILEIDTNGSISTRDAVGVAAKILQDQLSCFVNFDVTKSDAPPVLKSDNVESAFNKNLLKTIDELELSVRSYNCLKNESVIYVGDLVKKSESEMLKTANFGRKSLNELKENLKSMGLGFGMKLPSWPPKNIEELLKQKNKEF